MKPLFADGICPAIKNLLAYLASYPLNGIVSASSIKEFQVNFLKQKLINNEFFAYLFPAETAS